MAIHSSTAARVAVGRVLTRTRSCDAVRACRGILLVCLCAVLGCGMRTRHAHSCISYTSSFQPLARIMSVGITYGPGQVKVRYHLTLTLPAPSLLPCTQSIPITQTNSPKSPSLSTSPSTPKPPVPVLEASSVPPNSTVQTLFQMPGNAQRAS